MPYFECSCCSEVILGTEVAGHLQNNHQLIIDVLVDSGLTEADAIRQLSDNSIETNQVPIPAVPDTVTRRLFLTPLQRLSLNASVRTMDVEPVSSGASLSVPEYTMLLERISAITSWVIDPNAFFASVTIYLVLNDGSDKVDEGGFVVYSEPTQVPGAAPGAQAVQKRFLTTAELLAAGNQAAQAFNRSFTLRRLGRTLYPAIYETHGNDLYQELNVGGTLRTREMGVSPDKWYLTVSFVCGVNLKAGETAILKQAVNHVGPVDAAPEEESITTAPLTLRDAKARRMYDALRTGSVADTESTY
jgi:hypothetical protein